MTEQQHRLQKRRASIYVVVNLIIDALLLPITIADLLISDSWVGLLILLSTALALVVYRLAIERVSISIATFVLFLLFQLAVGASVYNFGGVLTAASVLYSVVLVAVGLVLLDRAMVFAATAVTIVSFLMLAALEHRGLVVPPAPGPLLNGGTSAAYKLFSMAVQTVMIGLLGFLTGIMTESLQRRVRALEAAQEEADLRARELGRVTSELQEKVAALGATEDMLRSSIDALSVPVLPLGAGAVVMPLVGHIDAQRADRLVKVLLESVYERRSRLTIVDLTAILDATELLSQMLTRMALGVRLLGSELVMAGLQPALARLMVSQATHLDQLRSFQSLEQAIDYALEREDPVEQ
jgi:anti-anti-sigma regulatory factor